MSSPLYRVLVSGYGPHVHILEVVETRVSVIGGSSAGMHPSYLAACVSPRGTPLIYVVNETKPSGSVAVLAVERESGALSAMCAVASAGGDPCHVAVHPKLHAAYVSNYSGGGLSVHALNQESGAFLSSSPLQVLALGPHPHQVILDATGTRAFVPVLGKDAIYPYSVDVNGALVEAGPPVPLPPDSGPRHLALCELRGFAVTINELACTLSLLELTSNAASSLALIETVSSLPPGVLKAAGYSTAHVVVSPDGRFVYGSNRGHNSIGVWRVEGGSAVLGGSGVCADSSSPSECAPLRLVPVQWHGGGSIVWDAAGHVLSVASELAASTTAIPVLSKPRDFSLSPDPHARFLLCANQLSDSLTLFARDVESGELTAIGGAQLPAGSAPCCVVFPPWSNGSSSERGSALSSI
jgi:6-phosphogluconolactonase